MAADFIDKSLYRRSLLTGAAACLVASANGRAESPMEGAVRIAPSKLDYDYSEIDGRPLYVASQFRRIDEALAQHCVDFISSKLETLATIVPAIAWKKIAQVPIWLEYDDPLCAASCFWASPRSWLAKHGSLPDKAGGVQFTRGVWLWRQWQPMLVMHELAHAYHHLILTLADPSILQAYRQAVASGKYDHVRRNSGEVGRAYALRNFREFFAELTESYFGENDFEPYTRADLQRFDPESYAVIEAAWNKP
jgi:hypothetical protein